MSLTRTTIIAAIALGAAVSLTGCFGNPIESLVNSGVENAVEEATGSDVSIDTDGTGASLPSNFPSDIPVVDGKITSSLKADDVWTFTVAVADIDAAKEGYAALLNSGFTELSVVDLGEGNAINALESEKYTLSYSWISEEDGSVSVTYGGGLKQ